MTEPASQLLQLKRTAICALATMWADTRDKLLRDDLEAALAYVLATRVPGQDRTGHERHYHAMAELAGPERVALTIGVLNRFAALLSACEVNAPVSIVGDPPLAPTKKPPSA